MYSISRFVAAALISMVAVSCASTRRVNALEDIAEAVASLGGRYRWYYQGSDAISHHVLCVSAAPVSESFKGSTFYIVPREGWKTFPRSAEMPLTKDKTKWREAFYKPDAPIGQMAGIKWGVSAQ